jgi:hypothetical protein
MEHWQGSRTCRLRIPVATSPVLRLLTPQHPWYNPSTGLTGGRFYGTMVPVVLDGELAVPCTRKPP